MSLIVCCPATFDVALHPSLSVGNLLTVQHQSNTSIVVQSIFWIVYFSIDTADDKIEGGRFLLVDGFRDNC